MASIIYTHPSQEEPAVAFGCVVSLELGTPGVWRRGQGGGRWRGWLVTVSPVAAPRGQDHHGIGRPLAERFVQQILGARGGRTAFLARNLPLQHTHRHDVVYWAEIWNIATSADSTEEALASRSEQSAC